MGTEFVQGHTARPEAGPTGKPWPLTLSGLFFKTKQNKEAGGQWNGRRFPGVQDGPRVTSLSSAIKVTGLGPAPDHAVWAVDNVSETTSS